MMKRTDKSMTGAAVKAGRENLFSVSVRFYPIKRITVPKCDLNKILPDFWPLVKMPL